MKAYPVLKLMHILREVMVLIGKKSIQRLFQRLSKEAEYYVCSNGHLRNSPHRYEGKFPEQYVTGENTRIRILGA